MNETDCLVIKPEIASNSKASRILSMPRRALENLIDRTAAVAIFLDVSIDVASRKIFILIPKGVREKLQSLNSEYLAHRNRLLKIRDHEEIPTPPEEKVPKSAKHDSTKHDSTKHDSTKHDSTKHDSTKHDLAMQRGDVPGWVLVVLMTTGLVTALWTIAAPRLSQILRNSLDSMNGIR